MRITAECVCIRHLSIEKKSANLMVSKSRAKQLSADINGITKADREARKSDDLLKRDFTADAPLEKCVTDITEIKAKDGKLYVSAIFDCYDLMP